MIPAWLKGQIYTVGNDDGFSFACGGSSGLELFLPVDLNHFEAVCNHQGTRIYWSFSETSPGQQITLEKSIDGRHYYPCPFRIEFKETGYECIDFTTKSGARYYRLKIELPATEVEYSHSIAAICEPAIHHIHPNPSSGLFTINIPEQNALIHIADVAGKPVFKKRLIHTSEQINITDMKSGLYNVEIHTENGILTQRIIIVH